ncbi:response regulator transcription factor [Nocardioides sp. LS1]|uniref:response regulator transcription factor n=1 Tax=Nocardioides sp. LS1 TaxID=1027620 RepID=UPI000F6242FA|nr:response regulator transcription factor [Nocardioides sp. LS1]GCD88130.1 DNA-binding response regulator [Nocardioides sp. LS1]
MTLVATRDAEPEPTTLADTAPSSERALPQLPPVDQQEWTDGIRPQRVLVVDEHALLTAGLRAVLREAPWVESCLTAPSAEAALHVARRHYPQLVLVSTSLGGRSGPDLCRTIRQSMPHVKVVLMFGDGRVPAALAASLGAVAALSKNMSPGAILIAIRHVAEGGKVFPKGQPGPTVKLSRRELDVLRLLASGLSNPETAESLQLSRHTIKQHTSSVYRKLGVRNRAEAASRAQELGLLGWTPPADPQLRAG